MASLAGKIALIMAAAQGIGKATAPRFSAAGSILSAIEINEAALRELQSEYRFIVVRVLDVRSMAAATSLVKEIGHFVTKVIRYNVLCPGTIETSSLVDTIAAQGDYDAVRAAFIARQPSGRLSTPEEVAAAALYLTSDESSFMTGRALVVDGGWSI